MTSAELDRIYSERASVVASLAFTWSAVPLDAEIEHHIAIARGPSFVKDALSLQLLSGRLEPRGGGQSLTGLLALTTDGRKLVERCRDELKEIFN